MDSKTASCVANVWARRCVSLAYLAPLASYLALPLSRQEQFYAASVALEGRDDKLAAAAETIELDMVCKRVDPDLDSTHILIPFFHCKDDSPLLTCPNTLHLCLLVPSSHLSVYSTFRHTKPHPPPFSAQRKCLNHTVRD